MELGSLIIPFPRLLPVMKKVAFAPYDFLGVSFMFLDLLGCGYFKRTFSLSSRSLV